MAAFDFLSQDPNRTIPINARPFIQALGGAFPREWEALVDIARQSTVPVIISQEVLACLNTDGVRQMAASFDGVPMRAVAMHRPVSKLIPSLYQQEAQMLIVPPFEAYARRCLALLLGEAEHEYLWLDSGWLQRTWLAAGVPIEIVPATADVNRDALMDVLARLLPEGVPVPEVGHENEGLSAFGVEIWRAHLLATRPRHLLPALRVLDTFRAVDPWACDSDLGGSYRLREDVGAALDHAFPCPPPMHAAPARGPSAGDLAASEADQRRANSQRRKARAELAKL